jgi:hypothetical protein
MRKLMIVLAAIGTTAVALPVAPTNAEEVVIHRDRDRDHDRGFYRDHRRWDRDHDRRRVVIIRHRHRYHDHD